MKVYFVLLAFLFLSTLLPSGAVLAHAFSVHYLKVAKSVGDVVLFALCLVGCFGLAFDRRIFSAGVWGAVKNATLILGAFTVMLLGYGEIFGVPTPQGRPSLMRMGLIFLPYVLFAAPAVLYERRLRRDGD
ncbi:MAG: hypothetical protein PHV85_09890 [Desulfovibrionaceae bacterium]|nr:hypothetical protein [Desulfovibrionaceae bacterium]MDD4952848.1 hypothetical protein [Desulfovibrionaceae bacterium]